MLITRSIDDRQVIDRTLTTFKLTIAYDGTGFVGWQRQASGVSIQGLLEEAFAELDGREVPVTGAGRTDAGVHAIGQVASVSLERVIDGGSVVRALNTRLPESVRVLAAVEVPDTFHARFKARSKTYRYRIWNGPVMNPFERVYAWHIPAPPLDVEAMSAAAALVEGTHDFAAFQGTGTDPHSTKRTVYCSQLFRGGPGGFGGPEGPHDNSGVRNKPEGPHDNSAGDQACPDALITYEISGDGFLRHMVRNIAGTLVEIGRGRYASAWMAEVLASRDRTRAGRTAPAAGLFLVKVDYPEAC